MGLNRIEMDVPEVGLFVSSNLYPVAHFKRQTHLGESLVKPMRYIVTYNPKWGMRRCLEITLTKPMQIGSGQISGYTYEVSPRTDVKISRLVVNLEDLDKAIEGLIAEGNRFYFLFCYPL